MLEFEIPQNDLGGFMPNNILGSTKKTCKGRIYNKLKVLELLALGHQ